MTYPDALVYIAGPLTAKGGFTVEENIAAASRVLIELLMDVGVPAICPHTLSDFVTAHDPTRCDYDRWIEFDFALIDRCTHVLMLPRWTTSKGAQLEYEYAKSRQLPIYYLVDDLVLALKQQYGR